MILNLFFKAVRDFYVASLKKMLKKFPFGDSILDIINPDKFCSYSFSTVEGLAKRFSQLGLADSRTLDLLREEFMDFKLSPADHPPFSTYNSAQTRSLDLEHSGTKLAR